MAETTPYPIRVGMIALSDLDDPNPISGMPYRMAASLRAQGIEIVPLPAQKHAQTGRSLFRRAVDRAMWIHKKRTPMWVKRAIDTTLPFIPRSAALRRARSLSACAQSNLEQALARGTRIDALFGCCISSALYSLRTDLPVIYFSDATSPVLQSTYPVLALRGRSYRDALREVEHQALQCVDVAVFAAPSTQYSAIHDFGVPEECTRVVPMGAHVYPSDPGSIVAPTDAPTRDSCELLIVAADPVRKRVDLATETAEILRSRGIRATLHVVGPGTPRSRASGAVDSVGPLRLSDRNDRVRHQKLLADCHLQLLPSLGEAFGIAPAESAHFARPSIVADAGGLPFVVLDGQTGVVMPIDADPSAWADAVERIVEQPESYRAMSSRALERAREKLSWDAWGRDLRAIIEAEISNHRPA
ncbi:MAG: glycosyltransferase family 4 protein [Phycisphaerales bacterium]|nr:glycosyltransferase family 4 protein [Phycisphaerales bacterium]